MSGQDWASLILASRRGDTAFMDRLRVRITEDAPLLERIAGHGAVAALAQDGEHVEFAHQCVAGWTITLLPLGPWRVVQREPLTVDPSVSCSGCGWHGWITNGVCHRGTASAARPAPDQGGSE